MSPWLTLYLMTGQPVLWQNDDMCPKPFLSPAEGHWSRRNRKWFWLIFKIPLFHPSILIDWISLLCLHWCLRKPACLPLFSFLAVWLRPFFERGWVERKFGFLLHFCFPSQDPNFPKTPHLFFKGETSFRSCSVLKTDGNNLMLSALVENSIVNEVLNFVHSLFTKRFIGFICQVLD